MWRRAEGVERRRRADGERTRSAILDAAARLATVEGLDGLSLGRLARETGMSKSGLFAHFGSKEELQLATIAAAEDVFEAEVLAPAMAQPEGLPRLRALCEGFLGHVERRRLPGRLLLRLRRRRAGHPARSPARPHRRGLRRLDRPPRRSPSAAPRSSASSTPSLDPEQLVFEVNAMLAEANGLFLLRGDRRAFEMARRAIEARLA